MNTITDCNCGYCGNNWKCELSAAQTMACPGCGDKPDIKTSKPVTLSPIYTQKMVDNGELPLVGMEVEFEASFFTDAISNSGTCEIIAYFGDKVWINIMDFDRVINIKVIDFKPITPTIELVDGKAYQFDHINKKNLLGFYVSETDELNVNDNHFSSEHSTNIQLLEVKS